MISIVVSLSKSEILNVSSLTTSYKEVCECVATALKVLLDGPDHTRLNHAVK